MFYAPQALCHRQARLMLELSHPPSTPSDDLVINRTAPYLALALYRSLRHNWGLYDLTNYLLESSPEQLLQTDSRDDVWVSSQIAQFAPLSAQDLITIHAEALQCLLESNILNIGKSPV